MKSARFRTPAEHPRARVQRVSRSTSTNMGGAPGAIFVEGRCSGRVAGRVATSPTFPIGHHGRRRYNGYTPTVCRLASRPHQAITRLADHIVTTGRIGTRGPAGIKGQCSSGSGPPWGDVIPRWRRANSRGKGRTGKATNQPDSRLDHPMWSGLWAIWSDRPFGPRACSRQIPAARRTGRKAAQNRRERRSGGAERGAPAGNDAVFELAFSVRIRQAGERKQNRNREPPGRPVRGPSRVHGARSDCARRRVGGRHHGHAGPFPRERRKRSPAIIV